jgi:hypothetical protein
MDYSPSSDHDDESKYVEELQEFALKLSENPDKEPVASEIEGIVAIKRFRLSRVESLFRCRSFAIHLWGHCYSPFPAI